MLKKTLVALAIASVAGSVSAADITTTKYTVLSKQGAVATENVKIANASVTATDHDVVVTLNAEYKVDDLITFDFTGVDIDLAASTLVTKVTLADDPQTDSNYDASNPYTPAGDATPYGTMTLGLLTSTANQLVYRVTSLDYTAEKAENTTFGGTINVQGLNFEVASLLTSTQGSVTYSAKTSSNIVLDSQKTNTTVIFDAKDQFTGEVTKKLDAVIDVNEQRLLFTDAGTETNKTREDSATLVASEAVYKDPSDVNAVYSLPAVENGQTFTINGDFSFLGDADTDTGVITTTKVSATVGTPTVYADKIVIEHTTLASSVVTVDVSGEDDVHADSALSTQKFTADIDVKYTTAAGKADQVANVKVGTEAGEWKLNGAVVHVPFMPFRAGYSPIVNVSNTSNQNGDIEVVVYAKNDAAWVEPVSYMLPETARAKAESQTDITSALKDLGISGDVAFDIIVNAPKDDIEVNALFYRDGDRAVINTVKQD